MGEDRAVIRPAGCHDVGAVLAHADTVAEARNGEGKKPVGVIEREGC